MKLVHIVGFITKKFVTMQHGHMNVKILKIVLIFYPNIQLFIFDIDRLIFTAVLFSIFYTGCTLLT